MSGPHAHLCVGGPRDGQWFESRDRFIRVPMLLNSTPLGLNNLPDQKVEIDHFTYVKCTINTDEGGVVFWVSEDTTATQLITMLAKGYRP